MKKIFRALGLALVVLVLAACGQSEETTKVKLGVVGDKNDQWEYLQEELLEKENIEIELVKFTDYRQPIVSLDDGSIDMHSALTEIYMDSINEEGGYSNTTLGYTTLNPMGVFSEKIDSLDGITRRRFSRNSRRRIKRVTCFTVTTDSRPNRIRRI